MPRPTPRRAFAAALALLSTLALAGCSSCSEEPAPPDAPPATLSPVPAPPGLSGAATVPRPGEAWAKARTMIGGPVLFLPQSFGGMIATLFGLPLTTAVELDGDLPAHCAATLAKERGAGGAACAAHVKAGDRVVAQAEKIYAARLDPATGITLLESRTGRPGPVAIGVLGNYLLVATSKEHLLEIGPYAARTLPAAPVPVSAGEDAAVDIPGPALAGPLRAALRARLGKAGVKEGAGLFAGAVERALEILGGVERGRASFAFDQAGFHARLEASPKPGGEGASAISGMATGKASRVLELPEGTVLGAAVFERPEARASGKAAQVEAASRFFGGEAGLPPEARAKLEAALGKIAEGRGETSTLGLRATPAGLTAMASAAVASEEKVASGFEELVALLREPSMKSALDKASLEVRAGSVRLPGALGEARRIRVEERAPAKGGAKAAPRIDLLYRLAPERLLVAAGADAEATLLALASLGAGSSQQPGDAGAPPPPSLASNEAATRLVSALGPEVSLALLADVAALFRGRAAADPALPPAFALLSTSRAGHAFVARLDAQPDALRLLAKHHARLLPP